MPGIINISRHNTTIQNPPLKTGTYDTCSTENVKFRPNPFTNKEQCEDCRNASIIGVTDIKSQFKLKDDDLKGLKMVTEPKPAFLGGPDRRWYLVEQVEERAEEKLKEKEDAKKSAGASKDVKRKRDKEAEQEDTDENVDRPVKRGRGRPPKGAAKVPVVDGDGKPKRGRGRPSKAKIMDE
jgi:hypothetical protein